MDSGARENILEDKIEVIMIYIVGEFKDLK
jgi:hypothetical protein